eukprot:3404531-Pleurochrysis_carterae.AAC.8
MEVGAAAAFYRPSVVWDPRKDAIHARSLHIRPGNLGRIGVVGVETRTSVDDEDGVSTRHPMRVCWLMQLRKAITVGVVWIAESVHEHAHKCIHGPAHVQCRNVGFHVLQKIGADQLAQMCLRRQLLLAGLRAKRWPKINAPILFQSGHPHVVVQGLIRGCIRCAKMMKCV